MYFRRQQLNGTKCNANVLMVKTLIIREQFHQIVIDIGELLCRTKRGNRFILNVIDEGIRYPEAFVLLSVEAQRIVETQRIAECFVSKFLSVEAQRIEEAQRIVEA